MEQAGRTQSSLNKLSPEVRVVRMRDDGGEGPILLKDYPQVLVPLFFLQLSSLPPTPGDSFRSGAGRETSSEAFLHSVWVLTVAWTFRRNTRKKKCKWPDPFENLSPRHQAVFKRSQSICTICPRSAFVWSMHGECSTSIDWSIWLNFPLWRISPQIWVKSNVQLSLKLSRLLEEFLLRNQSHTLPTIPVH